MQIKHPNIVACQGYPYGALQVPEETYYDAFDGNRYAVIEGRVFNVHPFDEVVKGYPIRWELDAYQRDKWNQTRGC